MLSLAKQEQVVWPPHIDLPGSPSLGRAPGEQTRPKLAGRATELAHADEVWGVPG